MELLNLPLVKRTVQRTRTLLDGVRSSVTEQLSARVQSWSGLALARPDAVAPERPALLDVPNDQLHTLSRAELYELATLLDVRGRKNMRKVQLIASIEAVRATAAAA